MTDIHTNSFQDQVILITGSSRGIGRGLALAFAKSGAKIIINYSQSKKDALEIISEIEENNGSALAIKADVSNIKEVGSMFRQIIKKHGHIDILINNAGAIFENTDWTKHNNKNWDKTVAVNLTGVFNCIRSVAPIMIQQQSGKILNISSLRSILGATDIVAYAATKAGVDNLTKSYAKILSPHINVNSLVLSRINCGMNNITCPTDIKNLSSQNLIKRLGNTDDVFNAASFLVSPRSSFITGQILIVDGGASLI